MAFFAYIWGIASGNTLTSMLTSELPDIFKPKEAFTTKTNSAQSCQIFFLVKKFAENATLCDASPL